MRRADLVAVCALVACGAPARTTDVAKPASSAAPSASPTASAAPIDAGPAEPPWATAEPADARVTDPKGCEMPAGRVRVALSVDGTPSGVFLDHMSGVRGTVRIDPRGTSSAHVTFGSATFDAHVVLEASPLAFPQKPAPIGGILHVEEHVLARVTGGDATRLELTLVDEDGVFEWTTPQPVAVDCAAFGAKRAPWAFESRPEPKKILVPKNDRLPVRAIPRGDVVARVRVDRVYVTKEDKGMSAIAASTPLGLVFGWVDSAELATPPPPGLSALEGHGVSGGGVGRMTPGKVSCAPGTPLFLIHHERLYHVGRLHDATDPPVAPDWRVDRDGRVVLEMATHQPARGYVVLEDDLRVTNSFWHRGISGELVVPLGPAECGVPTAHHY